MINLEEKKDYSVNFTDLKKSLPEDLKEFLNKSGGALGSIGDSYIEIFSYAEMKQYNEDYSVDEFLPGYIMIGTLNDEAIVMDPNMVYWTVPFVGMFEEECVKLAACFHDLLLHIIRM